MTKSKSSKGTPKVPHITDRQIREMIVEDFQKCLRELVSVSAFPTELELIKERESDRIKFIMRDVIANIK